MITIRDRLQQPVNLCFRPAYPALPEFDYSPALLEQLVSVSEVSLYVLVEFRLPEVLARFGGRGVPAAWVPVPEATMNEDAYPVTSQHYIGFAWKILLVQAIPEAMPMQQTPDLDFRRCIATTNASHHARPDFFADYVHE